MPTLTMLCGLPAAGKSTWAMQNAHGARVVTADEIREGARASSTMIAMWNRARKELREGRSVIVDTCALRANDRRYGQRLGRELGARCELVMFCVGLRECRARNALRRAPAMVDWAIYLRQAQRTLECIVDEEWDAVRYVPRRETLVFDVGTERGYGP